MNTITDFEHLTIRLHQSEIFLDDFKSLNDTELLSYMNTLRNSIYAHGPILDGKIQSVYSTDIQQRAMVEILQPVLTELGSRNLTFKF